MASDLARGGEMVIEVPGVVRSWLTLTTGERVPLQIEWENEQEIAGLELDAIGWPMYRRWIIERRMVVRRERLVVDTGRGGLAVAEESASPR